MLRAGPASYRRRGRVSVVASEQLHLRLFAGMARPCWLLYRNSVRSTSLGVHVIIVFTLLGNAPRCDVKTDLVKLCAVARVFARSSTSYHGVLACSTPVSALNPLSAFLFCASESASADHSLRVYKLLGPFYGAIARSPLSRVVVVTVVVVVVDIDAQAACGVRR